MRSRIFLTTALFFAWGFQCAAQEFIPQQADSKAESWFAELSSPKSLDSKSDTITIISSRLIKGGIEMLVEAKDADGGNYGFGSSCITQIEKIRFINPPVLIDDPSGLINREVCDADGKNCWIRRLSFNPDQALTEAVIHAIDVIPKCAKADVVFGSIGKTTTVVYPEAGSGGANVTMDGTKSNGYQTTWSLCRSTVNDSGGWGPTNATGNVYRALYNASGYYCQRAGFSFDTSSVPDDDVISAATFSLKGTGSIVDANSTSAEVVSFAPVNSANYADSDWTTVSYSSFGSINASSWSTSDWNDFGLNQAGMDVINKTGITDLMTISGLDLNNQAPASSGNDNYIQSYQADQTGTTSDPILTITSAPEEEPSSNMTSTDVIQAFPLLFGASFAMGLIARFVRRMFVVFNKIRLS